MVSLSAQSVDVRDFVFHDIGDRWTYSGSVSGGGSGSISAVTTNVRSTFTFEGDATEVESTVTFEGQEATGRYTAQLSDEGLRIIESEGGGSNSSRLEYSPPKRELPGTLNVGETTNGSGSIGTFSDGSYTISTTVEGSEAISVPAGSFETLRVRIQTTDTTEDFFEGTTVNSVDATRWYARGVGLIKEVSTRTVQNSSGQSSTTSTTELTSSTRPLLKLPVDGPPPVLGQAVATGAGWYYSPWLGFVNPSSSYGWYFQQGLAWLYTSANNPEGPIWFYLNGLGWCYTSANDFPSMYSAERESWIIWLESTNPNVRSFYDFTTQETFTLN